MRIKARHPVQSVEWHVETTGKGLQLLSRQVSVFFLNCFELVNDNGIAIPALVLRTAIAPPVWRGALSSCDLLFGTSSWWKLS